MHVGRTAGIAVQDAEDLVRVVMRCREITHSVARTFDLVGLLEILPGSKIVSNLRRKGIVSYPFEIVRPVGVSGDAQHLFKREHHFNGSAKFRSASRISVIDQLVTCP